jgi:hypothetical protein
VTDDQIIKWFPIAFPFFFGGMWLLITTVLAFMSGWFGLQEWYADDGSEEPLLRLGWQSGVMGFGVHLNGVLTLGACRSGLSVRIWRIFGPFQKPLLIRWSEITAEPSRSFFTEMVKLGFGNPENGSLKISAASWSKLVAAAGQVANVPLPAAPIVSRRSIATRLFLEWVVITVGTAAFFYLAPRFISPPGQTISFPIGVCLLFPAIVFGIGQLVRFGRES